MTTTYSETIAKSPNVKLLCALLPDTYSVVTSSQGHSLLWRGQVLTGPASFSEICDRASFAFYGPDDLTIEGCCGDLTVLDTSGGRWWPSVDASREIKASSNPARKAFQIVMTQPMRGEWRT